MLRSVVFVLALGLAGLPVDRPAAHGTDNLVLLNWSEYLDPELIARFEKTHDVHIHQVYFESDDIRDDIMNESDGAGVDLIIVNGIMLETYAKRGWIDRIDPARLKNLEHITPRWAKAFTASETHGVPYFWGNLGIAYREDLVDTPPASWMDLYRPDEFLRGRIVMNKMSRDLIGMALKAQGHSANSADPEQLRAAERLLMEQKPYVRAYSYISLNEESSMVSGEVAMAMMYSGDALMLMEHHPNIRFVVPREGGNLWVDYLTVAAKSSKKALAYAFIDFLNEPHNAAQLAQYVYYATPNKAAESLLPREHLTDPVIYPNAEVLSRSEPYTPLPPRIIKLRNEIFARVIR